MSLRNAVLGLGVLCLVIMGLGALVLLDSRTRMVNLGDLRGVVFGPKDAVSIMGSTLSDDPAGYWSPTRRDLRTLEVRLRAHLQTRHPERLDEFSEYGRQYFGFMRGEGKRILVVGFCADTTSDWAHEFVPVSERGGCRFEAEYDMDSGRVLHFWASSE